MTGKHACYGIKSVLAEQAKSSHNVIAKQAWGRRQRYAITDCITHAYNLTAYPPSEKERNEECLVLTFVSLGIFLAKLGSSTHDIIQTVATKVQGRGTTSHDHN